MDTYTFLVHMKYVKIARFESLTAIFSFKLIALAPRLFDTLEYDTPLHHQTKMQEYSVLIEHKWYHDEKSQEKPMSYYL